jgi:hypothetical protein
VDEAIAGATAEVNQVVADRMRRSAGLNFGSRYLAGLSTWGVKEALPTKLRQLAAEVFAFDALIQNSDRRASGSPNILAGSSSFFLIDHELAFSFYYAVGGSHEPWKAGSYSFLSDHIFFSGLRRRPISLDRFRESLKGLDDAELAEMLEAVPQEWAVEGLERVIDHVQSVRDHADQFVEQVLGMLR